MDIQDSSVLELLAEIRIDVRSEGTPTDKASQNGHNPISFQGHMSTRNQLKTKDKGVHVNTSSEGLTSDKASQDTPTPTEDMPIAGVNKEHRPLFEAVVKGHWKAAEKILDKDPKLMMQTVMTVGNKSVNVLEFAVMAAQDYPLVEKLVGRLPAPLDPAYEESILRSALYDAARGGRIIMVKKLVKKLGSESVPNALSYAISNAPMQKEVIWHLARQTTSAPDFNTMSCLILAGHLDIGLFLADKYAKEVTSKDNINRSLLGDLAKMKSYFPSGDKLNFWEKCIYKCIPLCLVNTSFVNPEDTKMARAFKWFKTSLWNVTKRVSFIKRIGESKLRHKCSLKFANLTLTVKKENMKSSEILKFLLTSGIILDSASRGTHEIVELCLDHFPELMWDNNFPKELMREVVNGRQVELFRLVSEYNKIPKLSDDIFTNPELMEAVVEWSPKCVPADVPGAVFLMQRELQWFKVLEDRSDPSFKTRKFEVTEDKSDPPFKRLKFKETKERGGKTYWEVFVEQRQDLLKEAGQWMKDTSTSCSLIATLIITVAFTAAFTVPGGNNQSTGIPIFLKKDSFLIFTFADALALFSSVTATVMFLAVVTPCYTVEDILHSLPRKMIMGITSLFLSLASMLVAFSSALTIVLSERFKWIYILMILLAGIPVCFFFYVQFPLYVEMVKSIYRPRLCRPLKLGKKRGWEFNFGPKFFRIKAS
ncbi:hypothetical protein BT93_L2047 [Corymbia citriodora subsp. variegata]|uniref:PGG domain-containing protein n=1 Tax=Corymbia citriodora subsp. variegata TaxID=360336 RepID=A0A8T0CKV5_CORYI|nr:hypothetical protein BT93_L2047 [Corymbia citriodora subsp. variegata]